MYVQHAAQCQPQSKRFDPVISFLGMHLKEIMKHLFVIQHTEIYLQVYSFILACFLVLTCGSVPFLRSSLLLGLFPAKLCQAQSQLVKRFGFGGGRKV